MSRTIIDNLLIFLTVAWAVDKLQIAENTRHPSARKAFRQFWMVSYQVCVGFRQGYGLVEEWIRETGSAARARMFEMRASEKATGAQREWVIDAQTCDP